MDSPIPWMKKMASKATIGTVPTFFKLGRATLSR